MESSSAPVKIAIIGSGPRGLGAIEALIDRFPVHYRSLEFHLFDELQLPGAGPNFSPAQTPNCILNIPSRLVDIKPKLDLPCGGFNTWQKRQNLSTGDRFPPRAELGDYLMTRWAQAECLFPDSVKFHQIITRITNAAKHHQGWLLSAGQQTFGPFDEVLLTPGQPQTDPDEQMARWLGHAEKINATVINAYPESQLMAAAKDWCGKRVGIRGLGLSTFDVIRMLTLGLGGHFQDGTYQASGSEPSHIFAFSLNGQPPYPKPVDKTYDRQFDADEKEQQDFAQALALAVTQAPADAFSLIVAALLKPIIRIGAGTGAQFSSNDVESWLAKEIDAPGEQDILEPTDALKQSIAIAKGDVPPTVGYVIGQLWRKWQNLLRAGFNQASITPQTAKALVDFDEGLKRYSYGPPLQSCLELLTLIECGQVSLRVAHDPDVKMTGEGWHLVDGDDQTHVSAMVDAVLPSPVLSNITDRLFVNLKTQAKICQTYQQSGARTLSDGQLVGGNGETQTGLSLLGRLALGSVIAVDSIHDCFGEASNRWADGVVARTINSAAVRMPASA